MSHFFFTFHILFAVFAELPALKSLIGEELSSAFTLNPSEATLKDAYRALMKSEKDDISKALTALSERAKLWGKCPMNLNCIH